MDIEENDRVFWVGAPEVIGTVLEIIEEDGETIAEVLWDLPAGAGWLNVVQLARDGTQTHSPPTP